MQAPVLIVGGGPTGLCSSIMLSRFGIPSVLVERHPGPSSHPKATGISTRTMELFRQWGIEPEIRRASVDVGFVNVVVDTLAGPDIERRPLGYPEPEVARGFSATWGAACAQDYLEPILRDHAASHPEADIRFDTGLVDFSQTADGVDATIAGRSTGEVTRVHARFMIAADGAGSPVRNRLGIPMIGVERFGHYLSILFRADLEHLVGSRRAALYSINATGAQGRSSILVPTSRDGRWVFATPWDAARAPRSTLDDVQLVSLVRRAAGDATLPVDVLDARLVGIGAQVAERFRESNVFLVGDAAHRTTPSGGMGMNTAIHAAHNLAWKLAAVLQGWAGPGLLDSYEAERRPVGERNVARSAGQMPGLTATAADLGAVYDSIATVSDHDDRPAVMEPTSVALVGGRAPHVRLERDGRTLSSLDLFAEAFTLLAGPAGHSWREAAGRTAHELGVPLGAWVIGADLGDPTREWMSAYGVAADGAVLVRPDGHIAWRATSAAEDPASMLTWVLGGMLCHDHRSRARAAAFGHRAADRRCA